MPRWRPVERAGSLLRALTGRRAASSGPAEGARWSLVPRLSVLVLAIGFAALAIQIVVLRLWTEPLFEDHAQALAAQVRSIHAALRQTPAERRPALADALTRGPVELSSAAPEVPGELLPPPPPARIGSDAVRTAASASPPDTPFAGRLAQVLGAVKLHDGRPGRLVFELPVAGETWWLTLRAPASPQLLLDTALLWLALLAVASGLATVFGLRWIARPLRRLAGQIGLQRSGRLRPIVPDPHASNEVHTLVYAFNELVHANAMAASVRQQLLAGVSHDLRTPLARLRLRIETQCEPPLSDALETDLLALQHIVDQFLAYVQGDAAPRMGRLRPVAELLVEVADGYAAQGLAVDATWPGCAEGGAFGPGGGADHDGDGGVDAEGQAAVQAAAALRGPELALRRLLENLVNNALAHGRAPVTLRLWQAPGAGWRLAVCDHGRGMTGEEFEDARRPFVRLRETRHEVGHCGLGLAIVDQIAQQLGAQLEVRPAAPDRPFAIVVAWPAQVQGVLTSG